MQKQISIQTLTQNLKDAGCDPETIRQFLEYFSFGKSKEQLGLLARQRDLLLNRIHLEERQISCLDYLVFQIGRTEGNEEDAI